MSMLPIMTIFVCKHLASMKDMGIHHIVVVFF